MPFRIHVVVTPADEVVQLRQDLEAAQLRLAQVEATLRQTEYKLGCEITINTRLCDFCKEQGVVVPRALLTWHE